MSEPTTDPTSRPAKSTRGKSELEKTIDRLSTLNDELYQIRRKEAFSDLKRLKLLLQADVLQAQRDGLLAVLRGSRAQAPLEE